MAMAEVGDDRAGRGGDGLIQIKAGPASGACNARDRVVMTLFDLVDWVKSAPWGVMLLALLLAAPGLLMFLQLDRDRARKDK